MHDPHRKGEVHEKAELDLEDLAVRASRPRRKRVGRGGRCSGSSARVHAVYLPRLSYLRRLVQRHLRGTCGGTCDASCNGTCGCTADYTCNESCYGTCRSMAVPCRIAAPSATPRTVTCDNRGVDPVGRAADKPGGPAAPLHSDAGRTAPECRRQAGAAPRSRNEVQECGGNCFHPGRACRKQGLSERVEVLVQESSVSGPASTLGEIR
jgi:hypothetical protein